MLHFNSGEIKVVQLVPGILEKAVLGTGKLLACPLLDYQVSLNLTLKSLLKMTDESILSIFNKIA